MLKTNCSQLKTSFFYNYINTKLNNTNLIPPFRNLVYNNIIYTNNLDKVYVVMNFYQICFMIHL